MNIYKTLLFDGHSHEEQTKQVLRFETMIEPLAP